MRVWRHCGTAMTSYTCIPCATGRIIWLPGVDTVYNGVFARASTIQPDKVTGSSGCPEKAEVEVLARTHTHMPWPRADLGTCQPGWGSVARAVRPGINEPTVFQVFPRGGERSRLLTVHIGRGLLHSARPLQFTTGKLSKKSFDSLIGSYKA